MRSIPESISTGRVPAQWKDDIIVPMYNGNGPKGDCNSYRPITLLSVPEKVFAHVLLRRIEPLLIGKKGCSSQDSHPADPLAMQFWLSNYYLICIHSTVRSVTYVDIKSAFNSVDREALWKAVLSVGVPGLLVNLIRDLHSDTNSQLRITNCLSPSFTTRSGVQGL